MARWELSTQGMTTEQAFGRYYENYAQMLKQQGINGGKLSERLGNYSEALQQKLKFEPQNLEVGREIAKNPSAYGLNNVTREVQQAERQLRILNENLGNGAAPLGNIAPEASQKVTFTKIKDGVNKGKWGVYVDGKLDSVHDTKTKANTAFNAKRTELGQIMPKTPAPVAEPIKPAAEPAAQPSKTTEPAGQKKFTRGDRVRANNLWTTRVRPDLEAQLTPNPLTQSVLPNRDFSGRNFLDEANQAAASKPAAEPKAPVAEPAAPAVEPAKPIAEPAKPTVEPAKPIAEPAKPVAEPVKPKAPKGAGKGVGKFFNGKGGKLALILGTAALVATAFGLAKGCSEDKNAAPVKDETKPENTKPTPGQPEKPETPVAPTTPEAPTKPETPAKPEEPAYEPIVGLNDDGTYTTKKGDNFYKLAENLLKDYCAQNKIDKTITAESPEVQVLAERIMRKNEYWYDSNCTEENKRYSAPMLYPNITLNMVEFNDLVKKADEAKEEEKIAA